MKSEKEEKKEELPDQEDLGESILSLAVKFPIQSLIEFILKLKNFE